VRAGPVDHHLSVRSRRVTVAALVMAVAVAVAVGVVGSNRSDDDRPYDALSPEALRYVVPDSDDWGSGTLCPDGGSCSGAITVEVIERYDWFRITDLAVGGDGQTGGSVKVGLDVAEARASGDVAEAQPRVRAWGPDVDDVVEALANDLEVWAGVDRENAYAVVFVAFDGEGRLAGVGYAAAAYFTVPVASLAAGAHAPSGFAFLDPLMSR
jgi:hypothetical protein